MLAFAGPGFLVAVGYMDPGNWATDLAGGAQFGYTLLSVIMVSNLMAILLQHLCVKLGIATGRDLAQACRDHYSKRTVWFLWVLCEIANRRLRSGRGRRFRDRAAAAVRHSARLGLRHHRRRRASRSSTCRTRAFATSKRWWSRSSPRSASASRRNSSCRSRMSPDSRRLRPAGRKSSRTRRCSTSASASSARP